MTSKYTTTHTLPDELPKILKDFTKEVLRAQPANIYQFGADYFNTELRKLDNNHVSNGNDGEH